MRCLIIAARYLTRPCWAGVPTQSPVAGAPAVPRSVGVNRLLIVGPDDVLAGAPGRIRTRDPLLRRQR